MLFLVEREDVNDVYSSRFFFFSPNIVSKLVIAKPKTDIALVSSPVCGKVFWPPTEPGVVCTRAAGVEPAFVGPAWLFCLSRSSELAALLSAELTTLEMFETELAALEMFETELTALEMFETVSLFRLAALDAFEAALETVLDIWLFVFDAALEAFGITIGVLPALEALLET